MTLARYSSMLKIIIPTLIFSLTLSFLPESFWMRLSEFIERFLKTYSSEFSLKSGQKLLRILSELEAQLAIKGTVSLIELPQYKFYTTLAGRVMEYGRRYGTPLRSVLLELREALGKDLQFEAKIKKELWGGFAQFALIAIVTWTFVFLSASLLELHLDFKINLLMMVLQGGGFLSYYFIFRILRSRLFSIFSPLFSSYYTLLVLSEAGLSVRSSLQESGIVSLLSHKDKRFDFLFARSRELLERWQNKGTPLKSELKELISSAWALEEESFARFLKLLAGLKFLILCLSFLSAYFVYLFSLFRVFLIE